MRNPYITNAGLPPARRVKLIKRRIPRNTCFVVCPYCQSQWDVRRLAAHVQIDHKAEYADWRMSQNMPRLVSCPYCPAAVKQEKLVRHITLAHPGQSIPPASLPAASTHENPVPSEKPQD